MVVNLHNETGNISVIEKKYRIVLILVYLFYFWYSHSISKNRLWRIGQKQEVREIHFIIKNSIEQTVIESGKKKMLIEEQMLNGGGGDIGAELQDDSKLDLLKEHLRKHPKGG